MLDVVGGLAFTMSAEKLNICSCKSKDLQKLISFVGIPEANRFHILKTRLHAPENDQYYWIRNKTPQELTEFLDAVEARPTRKQRDKQAQDGAMLLYRDKDWLVYQIFTYEAAVKYGKHTKWCISRTHLLPNGEQPSMYFKKYSDAGVRFYFYLNTAGEKYAVAVKPHCTSIFNSVDVIVPTIPNAPYVFGLPHFDHLLEEADLEIVDGTLYLDTQHLTVTSLSRQRAQELVSHLDIHTVVIRSTVKQLTKTVKAFISSSVRRVILEEGVEEIQQAAFTNCALLEKVLLPTTLKSIHKDAFSMCTNLRFILIPDGVVHVGAHAFFGCTQLSSVKLSNSMEVIASCCFQDCKMLRCIKLPSTINKIDRWAFSNCKSLTQIVLPDSITHIAARAFEKSGLISITLPESIQTLEGNVFADCYQLETVNMPSVLRIINKGMFSNCLNLHTCNPHEDTEIDNTAFQGCSTRLRLCTNMCSESSKLCVHCAKRSAQIV